MGSCYYVTSLAEPIPSMIHVDPAHESPDVTQQSIVKDQIDLVPIFTT